MTCTNDPLVLPESSIFEELHDLLSRCRLSIHDANYLIQISRKQAGWRVRNLYRARSRVPAMPRVLLLDSDADSAEMYATGLRIEGFAAAIAEDLATALEHIRRGQPDAVVAEASDAARDDWRIVRWCRDGEAGHIVPVVLLTGYPPASIPPAASKLGCAALLKPCLPETLAQVIRALINAEEDRP